MLRVRRRSLRCHHPLTFRQESHRALHMGGTLPLVMAAEAEASAEEEMEDPRRRRLSVAPVSLRAGPWALAHRREVQVSCRAKEPEAAVGVEAVRATDVMPTRSALRTTGRGRPTS